MELDEFKAYWNMQEREIEKQKLNMEILNNILTKTTTTLSEIQAKNKYWNKLGTAICSMLIVIMLFYMGILYFVHKPNQSYGESVLLVNIMLVFGIASIWVYKRQEEIFNIDMNDNLKDALAAATSNFKRFYLLFNLAYLILYPAYTYAFIGLFLSDLQLSNGTICLICIIVTVVSFAVSHWYYSVQYFRRIKALEENLNELF